MHQLTLQQISNHINKQVDDWTSSDICQWLLLNQIEVDTQKISAHSLNGVVIRAMTPNQWMEYGVTKYIAKQIVQWLEQEVQEFNDIVQQKLFFYNQPVQNQIKLAGSSSGKESKQNNNNKSKKSEQLEINQISQILEFPKNQRKIKSEQHLKQQSQVLLKDIKFNKCQSLLPNLGASQPINYQIQNNQAPKVVKQSEKYSDSKSQGILSEQEQYQQQQGTQQQKNIQKQRINSEITERKQKKKKKSSKNKNINNNTNQNADLNSKQQKQKQPKQKDVVQNQIANISKWGKKKKQQSIKNLNQRIKNKNKDSYDPKIYQYISYQNNDNKNDKSITQKSAEIKGISQRVFSSQQFCHSKMVSPNQRADYKIPVRQNPINPYSLKPNLPLPKEGLQNPNVKFVTSLLILPPVAVQNKRFFQKKLKIKTENTEYIISGCTKIGRLKNNQIVLGDQSVSRHHAEIVPEMEMTGKIKFFLKDIGSKFGTFVQCKKLQQDIQGKSFLVGDSQIQIINGEPSKPITPLNPPLNRRLKFDLKTRIDREKDLITENRSIFSIGNRLGNDIKLQSNCEGAKIWYQKQKKVCLQAIGKLYQKLKEHQLWDIEANANSKGQVEVVFGWLKVNIEVLELCLICGVKKKECQCPNQEDQLKNYGKN